MTQTKIVGVVIIGGILIAGGYFAYSWLKTNDLEVVGSADSRIDPNDKKMAFSEFLKTGGSYKCTVHQYVGDVNIIGQAYISDGLIRGEYNTKAQGMNIDATMIVRDGYTYTWSSVAPGMGFKVKVVENDGSDNGDVSTVGTYSFNAEQIGDYDCKDWNLDESKFVVPTTITFKEL